MPSEIAKIDGSLDFSGGIDSNRVTTVQSELNPNGLPRNMLAWLTNGSVRNGTIQPRTGFDNLGTVMASPGLYQGGYIYEPRNANPYLVFLMSGVLYAIIDPDNPGALTDLTGGNPALLMPAAQPQAFFVQAEEFLVVQAGDYVTLPLIWDGATLRRSVGLAGGPPAEIPAAGPMDYYMGRLWYAQGRTYGAGDIVGNAASGTAPYNFRDSVLKVTENPLCLGGDNFTVPSNAGNIRALAHSANLNSMLGQGQLYIFTRKAVYTLQVPITRTDWIGADANNMPLQYAVLIANGSVNDRSITKVNGDLFFQSLEPAIRSFTAAVRNFQQWGDTPISVNENRILAFNNRALLWASSGIYFDNRLLQTALPEQSANGVIHKALIPLNFDTISSLAQKLPPVWEGMYDGLNFLQLFTGDFGGLDRAFSLVISSLDGSLQLWELTNSSRFDYNDRRITMRIEFPAFTEGREFSLKELLGCEIWLDRIVGTVDMTMEYRPDSDACWYPWHKWKVCAARNCAEDVYTPVCYPDKEFGPGYKSTLTLPHPPNQCNAFTGRPAYMGYQFQPRLTIHGWCRVRGLYLWMAPREREMYAGKVC